MYIKPDGLRRNPGLIQTGRERQVRSSAPHAIQNRTRQVALFPNRSGGGARQSTNLGQNLTDEIYRQSGLRMNPHLFRHFAAYLYLRERPGDFETVRRMLRHKKLETTMTFYAELSNKWAHGHYDDVVLKKWGGSDGK